MKTRRRISEDGPVAQRSVNLTPDAYMQVVGIVQAFAFGYLLSQQAWLDSLVGAKPQDPGAVPDTGGHYILTLLQLAVVFHLIVLTWHVNTQNMMAFKRLTGLLDSVIPLVFILPEYFMIKTCSWNEVHLWWAGVAAFMFMAVIAYLHLLNHVRHEFNRHNARILNAVKGYFGFVWKYISVVGLFALVGFTLTWPGLINNETILGGWTTEEVINVAAALVLNGLILGFTRMHVVWFWHSALRVPPDKSAGLILRQARLARAKAARERKQQGLPYG